MASETYQNPRIDHPQQAGDPARGKVTLDVGKTIWFGSMAGAALVGGALTFSWGALALFVITTATTLCLGHSLGMHRRFIHRSYECPLWMEYLFVHFGTLVGLAGPLTMLAVHDTRDWAQRQRACHDYFGHRQVWYRDLYWQVFCSIQLERPPSIQIEPSIEQDRVFRFMERTWMAQQLPWAILFLLIGGWGWVFWGICARVTVSVLGHWAVGYVAHNRGEQEWVSPDASVQGYNVAWCALITMGESWHNNHHANPRSPRLGIKPGQWDPGWWVLRALERIGVVRIPQLTAQCSAVSPP